MSPETMALSAVRVGNAVVRATGTPAWPAVRERVARCLGRGDPDRERDTATGLDETAASLTGPAADHTGWARADRAEAWRARVAAFLDALAEGEQADAVADLAAVCELVGGPRTPGVGAAGTAPSSPSSGWAASSTEPGNAPRRPGRPGRRRA